MPSRVGDLWRHHFKLFGTNLLHWCRRTSPAWRGSNTRGSLDRIMRWQKHPKSPAGWVCLLLSYSRKLKQTDTVRGHPTQMDRVVGKTKNCYPWPLNVLWLYSNFTHCVLSLPGHIPPRNSKNCNFRLFAILANDPDISHPGTVKIATFDCLLYWHPDEHCQKYCNISVFVAFAHDNVEKRVQK